MHVFEMVVLIVLIGSIASIVNKHMERKGQSMTDALGLGDDDDPLGLGLGSKNSVSLERLEKLEERVAVLEKIITDRNYDLKEEIDRL
ncbi:MAG: hypothetical protein AB8G18_03455 [Gammaproteobacteria bacterium]